MHINIVRGDFTFQEWKKDGWKDFIKKANELKISGFRKVNQEHDYLNYYEYYKKNTKKKVKEITITMMCV